MIKKIINHDAPLLHDDKNVLNVHVIIKEISSCQAKQEEKAVIDYLYKMYKNSNYTAYLIGKKEFEHFLKTMLPIYLKEYKK